MKTRVYNNYPRPKSPSEKHKKVLKTAAQAVLDIRDKYMKPKSTTESVGTGRDLSVQASEKGCSLADLYDPLTMPPDLVKAHQKLDKAVDLCYRPQAFTSESLRMEFLFELYNEYVSPLIKEEKPKRRRKKS
jgi:hypothetical protein